MPAPIPDRVQQTAVPLSVPGQSFEYPQVAGGRLWITAAGVFMGPGTRLPPEQSGFFCVTDFQSCLFCRLASVRLPEKHPKGANVAYIPFIYLSCSCGSNCLRRSTRRNGIERLIGTIALPYRCESCNRRMFKLRGVTAATKRVPK